jgi:hypothetical protein
VNKSNKKTRMLVSINILKSDNVIVAQKIKRIVLKYTVFIKLLLIMHKMLLIRIITDYTFAH